MEPSEALKQSAWDADRMKEEAEREVVELQGNLDTLQDEFNDVEGQKEDAELEAREWEEKADQAEAEKDEMSNWEETAGEMETERDSLQEYLDNEIAENKETEGRHKKEVVVLCRYIISLTRRLHDARQDNQELRKDVGSDPERQDPSSCPQGSGSGVSQLLQLEEQSKAKGGRDVWGFFKISLKDFLKDRGGIKGLFRTGEQQDARGSG